MRRSPIAPAALLLLSLPAAAQDLHPPGATISGAAHADITPEGFNAITALLPGLVPSGIEIPEVGDEYEGVLGQCWLGGYEYNLSNGMVDLAISSSSLVPQSGYLDLDATMVITVNSSSSPLALLLSVECIDTTCDGYIDPFEANIHTTLALRVVDGVLDAEVGEIALTYGLSSSDIHIDDCWIGTMEDVLGFFGLSIFDLILPLVEDTLVDAVGDFAPEIETLIEDAFSQVVIQQTLDLNGAAADLELYPSDVLIEPSGVRLTLDGYMDATTANECVAAYDPGGSLRTDSSAPAIGSLPGGVTAGYHAGILLSDDFGNQALYSLWRAGLLCYTIDDSADIGIPISTDLLGLLAGDAFDELFPESKPMIIQTRPKASPTLEFDGEYDVGMIIEQLGLEFYGELDHRQALVVGVDLDALAGIDLSLDGATGEMAIDIALEGEDVITTVTDNEFAADASADIEDSFAGVFDSLVGSLIGGLVGDLAFSLPSFEGFGLAGLEVAPAGTDADWMGAYATLAPVTYESAGCDEGGGCDLGCASGSRAPGAGWLLVGLPLMIAGLRRRREA